MTENVLYAYWRSSASYLVRIALNLLGMSYRRVPVDLLAGEQREPAHLERNPQGFVPVPGLQVRAFMFLVAERRMARWNRFATGAPRRRTRSEVRRSSTSATVRARRRRHVRRGDAAVGRRNGELSLRARPERRQREACATEGRIVASLSVHGFARQREKQP